MHPDGLCCCLQAPCRWQLRLRCRPKISVFQLGATIVNDLWDAGAKYFQSQISDEQVNEFIGFIIYQLLSVFLCFTM